MRKIVATLILLCATASAEPTRAQKTEYAEGTYRRVWDFTDVACGCTNQDCINRVGKEMEQEIERFLFSLPWFAEELKKIPTPAEAREAGRRWMAEVVTYERRMKLAKHMAECHFTN